MYFVITQNTRSERREVSRSPRGVSAGCPTQSFFPPPPAHNMPKPPDREARARKRRKITADVAAAAAARAAAAAAAASPSSAAPASPDAVPPQEHPSSLDATQAVPVPEPATLPAGAPSPPPPPASLGAMAAASASVSNAVNSANESGNSDNSAPQPMPAALEAAPAQVCRPAGHGGPRGAGLSTSRYRYSIPTAGRRPATSLYFLKSRFQVYRLSEKAREFGPTKQTQYGHVLPFCHPKHLLQLRNLIKREAPVCLPCRLGRLHYPGISGLYPR